MEPLHAVLLIFIGIGGGFIQRVSGFGLGIFVMMFLPHFVSSSTAATAISTLLSVVVSVYNAVKYRKEVHYKTVIPMILLSLITIPIAVHFAKMISVRLFKMLLGGILILLSIYFIFFNKKIKMKPSIVNGAISGALGGTLTGLFSTGGPPVVLYLSSAFESKITYFATIQFFFFFTNTYATVMRIIGGTIDKTVLIYSVVGVIGCLLGDLVGKRVFDKLDGEKFKKLIYIGMIISGTVMFF